MNELVSIVIPVYNVGNKIKKSVQAVLNQTYNNIEIILVDDGSKDNSYKICMELKMNDKRIKVVHTDNQGSGPARNEGIKNASGKFIYFPDADDYIEPNTIECLINAMRNSGADLVVFGFKNIDINGNLVSKKIYEQFEIDANDARKNYSSFFSGKEKRTIQGAPWNKFFNLELIKANNIEYPALRRHQDECFIARYVNYSKKIYFIKDCLYTYYVNDLARQWDKYPLDYIDIVEGLFNDRKNNILKWNKKDMITRDLVLNEYICGVIKALELSFSPKFDFNLKKRKEWIKKTVKTINVEDIIIPNNLGRYQNNIIRLMKKQQFNKLYMMLKIKVWFEKKGIIQKLKNLL